MYIKVLFIKAHAHKRACNIVSQSSKYEETTFHNAFIFVFIPRFFWEVLSQKFCDKWVVGKKIKSEDGI